MYLARQSVSNKAVVVKVLAANLVGDSEASARFERARVGCGPTPLPGGASLRTRACRGIL